jgi:hypothetical protein
MVFAGVLALIFGAILSRHFKFLVLVPSSIAAIVFVLASSLAGGSNVFSGLFAGVWLTCLLQLGYFLGLFVQRLAADPKDTSTVARLSHLALASSRHIRGRLQIGGRN